MVGKGGAKRTDQRPVDGGNDTGEGKQEERSQALITLATKKKRLADFIYSQEEDRKRRLKDLTGRDMEAVSGNVWTIIWICCL